MRRGVLQLSMSALGLTSGTVRHAGPVALGAKQADLSLSGLRQHCGHRCSTHLLQVRRGLAWEAQTQSTTRDTAAHAGGGQWGNVDQPQVSDYKVASMPFDSMASNAVSLIGFTGRDLELKRLQNGNTVGNLTLAVSHKAGETSWYDIDIWGPMAQRIAEQVPKGSRICIQGKLNPFTWTNREGVKQTKFKITAHEVRFVERNGGVPAGAATGQAGWGAQQPQQQGWGAAQGSAQDRFDQAPPAGAEWGNANNVVPSAQPSALPMPNSPHSSGAISAQSSAEEKWTLVRTNPGLWWDNRVNKRNPRGPDYSLKDKSVGIALWLDSKDTPEWAKKEFAAAGAAPAYQGSGFTDMN